MQPYAIMLAMAAALLLAAPVAGKAVARAVDGAGIFDPITCAMDASGPCSRAHMVAHRQELDVASAGNG